MNNETTTKAGAAVATRDTFAEISTAALRGYTPSDCEIPLLMPKASARRLLYGDEVDNRVERIQLHTLMSSDAKSEKDTENFVHNEGLSDFEAVLHPDKVHNYFNGSDEGKAYSVCGAMAKFRGNNVYSFCSIYSRWDKINLRHAYMLRTLGGTMIWADRHFVRMELEDLRRMRSI